MLQQCWPSALSHNEQNMYNTEMLALSHKEQNMYNIETKMGYSEKVTQLWRTKMTSQDNDNREHTRKGVINNQYRSKRDVLNKVNNKNKEYPS